MPSMDSRSSIANAGNVTVPAYLTLIAKGYSVRCEKRSGTPEEVWYAESDAVQLIAEDIVTLLGLASMFEARGSDWKASDEQIDDFLKRFEYDSPPS